MSYQDLPYSQQFSTGGALPPTFLQNGQMKNRGNHSSWVLLICPTSLAPQRSQCKWYLPIERGHQITLPEEPYNKPKVTIPYSPHDYEEPPIEKLSLRAKEVLALIVDELSTEEIAEKLSITKSTVNYHRSELKSKIGARNTVGMAKYALRHRIISEVIFAPPANSQQHPPR